MIEDNDDRQLCELNQFITEFFENQEDIPEEMEKIFQENMWSLLERDNCIEMEI